MLSRGKENKRDNFYLLLQHHWGHIYLRQLPQSNARVMQTTGTFYSRDLSETYEDHHDDILSDRTMVGSQ